LDNSRTALIKILNLMIPMKYPEISNIRVDDDFWNDNHYYKVYLPVEYGDMGKFDNDDVRDDVKEYAKYVLGKDETIKQILFVMP